MVMQVHIIIATQILEEGLDVPSCNLVIRFDPSATVCSFIQSRGRARMENSDYLLLVGRHVFNFVALFVLCANLLTVPSLVNCLCLPWTLFTVFTFHQKSCMHWIKKKSLVSARKLLVVTYISDCFSHFISWFL